MAEIEWKGAFWKGGYEVFSVKELLTILKGYGPLEVLEFEKPGQFCGQLSLCISEKGSKEITIYALAVCGEERRGRGRVALRWLKDIFDCELYAEDPGTVRAKNPSGESLLFWMKMYREGLVNGVEGEQWCLLPDMSEEEITRVEEKILKTIDARQPASEGA